MSRERNNLKAGLFVVAGIVLVFVAIFVLSDFSKFVTKMQTVEIAFDIADGLHGLKTGADVTIGHVSTGAVTQIDDVMTGDHITAKKVTFQIPAKYKIYENAVVQLDQPPLGSGTKLNIAFLGEPASKPGFHGASWAYEAGDPPLPGGLAASQLAEDFVKKLGIEEQQRRQIQGIIANIEKLSAALGEDPRPIKDVITAIQKLTGSLAEDVPPITSALKRDVPPMTQALRKDVPEITGKVSSIVSDVQTRSQGWWKNVESMLTGGDKAVGTINGVLDENRPVIASALKHADATMSNAEEVSSRFRQETIGKVNAALDTANKAVDDVKDMTGNLKSLVAAQRPVLERAIANARLVSDQLKLAAIEIRRSPWRLMYTPTTEELESDNIYDAARSFATAADSLNATADSLQSVLDRYGSQVKADDPNFKLMLDALRQTFEKFAKAEQQFFNALNAHGGK